MRTAYPRGLARDKERGPAESAGAPPAIPVPTIPGASGAPMDVLETSRKRSAEDAGHETDDAVRGGVQPDPACRRTCGGSVLMLWHWQKRARQQGSSDELVL